MRAVAEPDVRKAGLLFAAGALAGLALAVGAALGPFARKAAPGAVAAMVGDVPIPASALDDALSALAADKRNALTPADREDALGRLIDEELLVQRGLDLGIAREDPPTRKALVDAMVRLATTQADAQTPGDAVLERFYQARPLLGAGEPLLRLRASTIEGAPLPLPGAPVPLSRLPGLIGPTLAGVAAGLEPGQRSAPVVAGGQSVIVELIEKRETPRPAFAQAREMVLEAWRRERRDAALEAYLADLRRRTPVERAGAP